MDNDKFEFSPAESFRRVIAQDPDAEIEEAAFWFFDALVSGELAELKAVGIGPIDQRRAFKLCLGLAAQARWEGRRCSRCHQQGPNPNGCAQCNPVRLGERLTESILESNEQRARASRFEAEAERIRRTTASELQNSNTERDIAKKYGETLFAQQEELKAKVSELEERQQEHLALIVKLTNETPFAEEVQGWVGQRGKLVAELGTQKARIAELEREAGQREMDWNNIASELVGESDDAHPATLIREIKRIQSIAGDKIADGMLRQDDVGNLRALLAYCEDRTAAHGGVADNYTLALRRAIAALEDPRG